MHKIKKVPWQVILASIILSVIPLGCFIGGLYILFKPSVVTAQDNSYTFALLAALVLIVASIFAAYSNYSIYKGSRKHRINTISVYMGLFIVNSINELSNSEYFLQSLQLILVTGLYFIAPTWLLYTKDSNNYFNTATKS